MLKLHFKRVINNVTDYYIFNGELVYQDIQNKLYIGGTIFEFNGDCYSNINETYIQFCDDKYFYELNENGEMKPVYEKTDEEYFLLPCDGDEVITNIGEKNGEKIILRKNKITGQVIWVNQALMIDYNRDCLIFYHEYSAKSLLRCDLDTGQISWSFIIPNDDYKSGHLMFFKQYIFVPTHAGHLYALDRHTGALLWHLDDAFNYYQIDAPNHRLVGVGGHYIHLIDIRTGARTVKLLDETLLKQNKIFILQHQGCWDDGNYYFVSNEEGILKIGALDLDQAKLLCIEEVGRGEDSYYGAYTPVVSRKKMYFTDTNRTLFEYSIEL